MTTVSSEKCVCTASGQVGLEPEVDPKEGIVVRSQAGIENGNQIVRLNEGGKIVYELRDLDIVKPIVALSNDAPVVEVGDTVATVNFNGSIAQGSNVIVSRSINPDPGGLDLTGPFNFQVSNVTRSTPGNEAAYSLQATDDLGNTVIANSSVSFKHRFFQGFSTADSLDEAGIEGLVNSSLEDSILSQYAGLNSYAIPATPAGLKYIYWCYPVGTTGISGAIFNGLPFPIVSAGNVTITNAFGESIEYVVIRSANRFGSTSLDIDIS